MNRAQLYFLVIALAVSAVGLSVSFLELRTVSADGEEGKFLTSLSGSENSQGALLESQLSLNAFLPLLGPWRTGCTEPDTSGKLTLDELFGQAQLCAADSPLLHGIYARPGYSRLEGAVGGIWIPLGLLAIAGFFVLGRVRPRSVSSKKPPAKLIDEEHPTASISPPSSQSDNPGGQLPSPREQSDLSSIACVVMVVFPIVLIAELPSTLLASRFRYPRWVFAAHCLFALSALARRA